MEFILDMLGLFGIMIGIFVVFGVIIYIFQSLFGNVKQYKPPARTKGPISEDQMKEMVYAAQLEKMKKKGAGVALKEKKTSKQESSSNLNELEQKTKKGEDYSNKVYNIDQLTKALNLKGSARSVDEIQHTRIYIYDSLYKKGAKASQMKDSSGVLRKEDIKRIHESKTSAGEFTSKSRSILSKLKKDFI